MKDFVKMLLFVLTSILLGCGTPEGERLQLIGEWRVDFSDLLVVPISDSPAAGNNGGPDEAKLARMSAAINLHVTILKLQRDGVAELTVNGVVKSDIPWEVVKTGTWEIAGSGANLKLKLSFPAILPPVDLTLAAAEPFDARAYAVALVTASLPNGEGEWTPIVFDTPNKYGTVETFELLLPSSSRAFERNDLVFEHRI